MSIAEVSLDNVKTFGYQATGQFLPTISTVYESKFDEITDNQISFYDISNLGSIQKNEIIQAGWLIDPIEPINSLRRLRVLKADTNRNGDGTILTRTERDIDNRSRGQNLRNISKDVYNNYKMRRKAEVLKYNKNKLNSKNEFSYYANRRVSKNKLLNIQKKCNNTFPITKPSTNSGIIGSKNVNLYENNNIQYYSNI